MLQALKGCWAPGCLMQPAQITRAHQHTGQGTSRTHGQSYHAPGQPRFNRSYPALRRPAEASWRLPDKDRPAGPTSPKTEGLLVELHAQVSNEGHGASAKVSQVAGPRVASRRNVDPGVTQAYVQVQCVVSMCKCVCCMMRAACVLDACLARKFALARAVEVCSWPPAFLPQQVGKLRHRRGDLAKSPGPIAGNCSFAVTCWPHGNDQRWLESLA